MALKIDKRCTTCKLIRGGDEKLLRRIQGSKSYVHGGESVLSIAKDYNFRYQSLLNHIKRHQGLDVQDLTDRRNKSIQKAVQANQVKMVVKHTDVRDRILEKGLEQLESGEIKLTAASLVAASKHQSDIEEKHLDRQMEVMKMIQAFASGEYLRLDESSDVRVNPALPASSDFER